MCQNAHMFSMVLLFLCSCVFVAASEGDERPFVWRFKAQEECGQKLRVVSSAVEGGRAYCLCFHRVDGGEAHLFGTQIYGSFEMSLTYACSASAPTDLHMTYSFKDIYTQASVKSFRPGAGCPYGRVTMMPPDADSFHFFPKISSCLRPELLWMCRGSSEGLKVTQFLFEAPDHQVSFVSAQVSLSCSPQVVVAWGYADVHDPDNYRETSSSTFDFSPEALFAPAECLEN